MSESDINALIEQISETIRTRSEGSLSVPRTKEAYTKLLRQYSLIEQKYVSTHAKGFVKGLLYHHNTHNNAALTALFHMRKGAPVPIAYAGDKLLLNALPELIRNEFSSLSEDETKRVRLGDRSGQTFSLVLKKMIVARDPVFLASVTSSTLFNTAHFDYCASLLRSMYERNLDLRSPIMMIYINNIATDISSIVKSQEGGNIYIDHFMLRLPRGSFLHAGVYTLVEFSDSIVNMLKSKYPESVRIFIISLDTYLVVYGDDIQSSLDLKRNRINFEFHGNSIPFRVEQAAIDSPQALYLFLEKL
jgi:hypothetical protein